MTTPTQAQIEAAASCLYQIYRDRNNQDPPHWEATLYAVKLKYRDDALAALTAAAQVGEQRMSAWDARYSGSAKEIEDHTIERCAQVAEHYDDREVLASLIAVAIRKLKDAP